MPSWFEGDLAVNGLRLHYYRTGGDKPPMLLAHGYTGYGLSWTRAAEALAAEWDVIMYDARGHGKSGRAGGHFTEADRVSDLVGVVRALGLERPPLVGHSMGAATVAQAAAQHPGLPRCVVLEDPAWYEPPDEPAEAAARRLAERRAYNKSWRQMIHEVQAGPREAALAAVREFSPMWSEIDQNLAVNGRRQVEVELFDHFPTDVMEWRSVVAKIRCPGLLLIGDNPLRNAILTVEDAEEVARRWPQVRWVQIKPAGHNIRFEQLEQYLAAVQPFLREFALAE